jgi:hypothetical protein
VVGVEYLRCEPGLNEVEWHAAQFGTKPGWANVIFSLFCLWQLVQPVTLVAAV